MEQQHWKQSELIPLVYEAHALNESQDIYLVEAPAGSADIPSDWTKSSSTKVSNKAFHFLGLTHFIHRQSLATLCLLSRVPSESSRKLERIAALLSRTSSSASLQNSTRTARSGYELSELSLSLTVSSVSPSHPPLLARHRVDQSLWKGNLPSWSSRK